MSDRERETERVSNYQCLGVRKRKHKIYNWLAMLRFFAKLLLKSHFDLATVWWWQGERHWGLGG